MPATRQEDERDGQRFPCDGYAPRLEERPDSSDTCRRSPPRGRMRQTRRPWRPADSEPARRWTTSARRRFAKPLAVTWRATLGRFTFTPAPKASGSPNGLGPKPLQWAVTSSLPEAGSTWNPHAGSDSCAMNWPTSWRSTGGRTRVNCWFTTANERRQFHGLRSVTGGARWWAPVASEPPEVIIGTDPDVTHRRSHGSEALRIGGFGSRSQGHLRDWVEENRSVQRRQVAIGAERLPSAPSVL